MDIQIRAKDHSHAITHLAKYYNKRSDHIVRLPDSDQFICYNCVELEPVSKDIDYNRVKKILDAKKKWNARIK